MGTWPTVSDTHTSPSWDSPGGDPESGGGHMDQEGTVEWGRGMGGTLGTRTGGGNGTQRMGKDPKDHGLGTGWGMWGQRRGLGDRRDAGTGGPGRGEGSEGPQRRMGWDGMGWDGGRRGQEGCGCHLWVLPAGVRGAVPEAAVPVPVLVGCVLGAFVLGALVAGLGAACTRRPAAPKGAPEPPSPRPPPAPRLYPPLPPHSGAWDPHPELPSPEPSPEPPTRTPHGLSTPQPPGPGPPLRATLEGSGAAGWSLPPPGPMANRVQPGSSPFAPWDGAPRRLDVPPDSPPPPRRPLAQRHSLGGAGGAARPPGTARGLTRMYSLGAPGGAPPWGPHAIPLQRSLSMKPPLSTKPPLPPKPPPVP